jgi:dihydrolipoamide dehydrogenase
MGIKNNGFDVGIIGAGPGGYVAAIRAAQLGLKVACIDNMQNPGGTCLNIGCIPSKALLVSSEHFFFMKNHGGEHGILYKELSFDLYAMMKRKQEIVKRLTTGVGTLLKQNGVSFFRGTGKPIAPGRVQLTEQMGKTKVFDCKNLILAAGSVPVELPLLPFDGESIVSSTEALSFERVPENLVIVGAGAIGLELGSVWSCLGADVTFIEAMPEIAPGMDVQLSRALRRALTRRGMSFHLSTRVTGYDKKEGRVVLDTEDESGTKKRFTAHKVLVAAGRIPAVKGLEIGSVGVSTAEKPQTVLVNRRFQTNIDGIYAIGDLIGPPMLAHKAEEEGIACAEIIAGLPGHVNYKTIPGIIYTSPEIATVGITEARAKEEGREVNVGAFRFQVNGRALTRGDTEGFVKIVADKKTDELLGVHIVGHYASELIAEAVAVMEFGGSAEDIARTVHAHPTLSEAVREAALAVDERQIHAIAASAKRRTAEMAQRNTD